MQLSYSLHLSNRRSAIRNAINLLGVEKHNHRKATKYKNNPLTYDNEILVGTNKLYQDVKALYLKEFEESRIEFNKTQKRKDRKIDDYFQKVSDEGQKDLAVEVIIQVGHMEFWQDFTQAERKLMTPFFKNQIEKLQKLLPNFKIANAVIHYDEKSPHVQLIGVPIKNNCIRGMKKQVSKRAVFSREILTDLQDKMREGVLKDLKNIYSSELLRKKFGHILQFELSLKPKTPGRNRDIFISEYIKMKEKMNADIKQMKEKRIKSAQTNIDAQLNEYKAKIKKEAEDYRKSKMNEVNELKKINDEIEKKKIEIRGLQAEFNLLSLGDKQKHPYFRFQKLRQNEKDQDLER